MNAIKKPDRMNLYVAGALFAGGLVLYALITACFPYVSSDGFLYLDLAGNIFDKGFVADSEPREKFLPFYPALIALVHLAGRGMFELYLCAHVLDIACGAAVSSLVFLIALDMGASRRTALFFAVIQLVLPVGLEQYREVSVRPLFTFLMVVLLFLLRKDKLLLAGMMAGLAVTTRYEAYLFIPVFVIVNIRKPKNLLYAGLGFVIVASPWWIRNLFKYGGFIHTFYMAELFTRPRFHLFEIAEGMLWEMGPMVLFLAAAGIYKLSRDWKAYLLGFGFLYVALHTVWWFYHNKFLLPLCPFIIPPAALGADIAWKWLQSRKPDKKRLLLVVLIILIALPLLLRQAFFFHQMVAREPEPYRQAARALEKVPANVAFLGSRNHILEHYSGHKAYTWKLIGDADPHAYVLHHYLEKDVGMLIWTNTHPIDYQRFAFLKPGKDTSARVRGPDGVYLLSYQYYATFGEHPRLVHVYNLLAERLRPPLERPGG